MIQHPEGAGALCFSCGGIGSKTVKKKIKKKESGDGDTVDVKTCRPCAGSGRIERKKIRPRKSNSKSYPSYTTIGPLPVMCEGDIALGEQEELSYLIGHWRLIQRIDKHRYSTDDVVTSYIACREMKRLGLPCRRICDMGCGIGSVLLMNAWQLPADTVCLGIEAQEERGALAVRSIAFNLGVQDRVAVTLGDLRDPHLLAGADFDLVTGTPPYFPGDQAAQPGCLESAGCIYEHRGGVESYCAAAAHRLRRPRQRLCGDENYSGDRSGDEEDEPPSLFVVCNTALSSDRVYAGCADAGLMVLSRVDVIPREGKPVLFCVFVAALEEYRPWFQRRHQRFTKISNDGKGSIEMTAPASTAPAGAIRFGRAEGSVAGEECEEILVRDRYSDHTDCYCEILNTFGKPTSRHREIYHF